MQDHARLSAIARDAVAPGGSVALATEVDRGFELDGVPTLSMPLGELPADAEALDALERVRDAGANVLIVPDAVRAHLGDLPELRAKLDAIGRSLHDGPDGLVVALASRKAEHELRYWRRQRPPEGRMPNSWYERAYTDYFRLDHDFYAGKRVLDIGCGPRGSLEWADMAAQRVGLDPLADSYLELGASEHAMEYASAPSEAIPFPDGHFDVVCSFNSLDHVDDLDQTIAEICRVVAPGGRFLLLTDVDHEPTVCEPVTFSWDIVDRFAPALRLIRLEHFEKGQSGMYASLDEAVPYDEDDPAKRYGILLAMFRRAA